MNIEKFLIDSFIYDWSMRWYKSPNDNLMKEIQLKQKQHPDINFQQVIRDTSLYTSSMDRVWSPKDVDTIDS